MKKQYFFLFFLTLLVFSCSKDSLLDSGQGPDQLADNTAYKAFGSVLKVYPGDDLNSAFENAKEAGKGTVVKLMPGEFSIGWIEVHEFFGTFTGSGPGVTIITNKSDLNPSELVDQDKLTGLITFIGGDVTVSNMSVQLTEMPWLNSQEMSMLLFSDYTAGFTPSNKYIKVSLDNLEINGLLMDVYPYYVNGVKFAPDHQLTTDKVLQRSNIDASITNSKFSKLNKGIYVWGCKSGSFRFGTDGANDLRDNGQSIVINENLGLNVKIWNNVIYNPYWGYTGIDLNTGEASIGVYNPLEILDLDCGTYQIRNNTITADNSLGFGIMDTWRMAHPEYDTWMKITWQDNTFIINNFGALGDIYCGKNMLFLKNVVSGDDSFAWIWVENFWWDWDGVLPNNYSEGCKFLNNYFLKNPMEFGFYMSKNCMLMGDLSNLTVIDLGENTNIIGKANYGHSNEKFLEQAQKRMVKMLNSHQK